MTLFAETCPRCGATLSESATRCAYCGTSIATPQARPSSSVPYAVEPFLLTEQSSLPPELAHLQAPKPVQPMKASGSIPFLFVFWTLLNALFLVLGIWTYIRDSIAYNRLSNEGITATATITNLRISSGDADSSDSYYVYYQFLVPIKGDTARYQGSATVRSPFFNLVRVGQTIEIVYWSADPSFSAIKSELRPASMPSLLRLAGIVGLFTLIGWGMISSSAGNIVNLNRLRLNGQTAKGIVFKRWTDTDADGDTTCFVAYAFRAEIPGRGIQLIPQAEQNKELYDSVPVGGTLMVRYLPGKPQICRADNQIL